MTVNGWQLQNIRFFSSKNKITRDKKLFQDRLEKSV